MGDFPEIDEILVKIPYLSVTEYSKNLIFKPVARNFS